MNASRSVQIAVDLIAHGSTCGIVVFLQWKVVLKDKIFFLSQLVRFLV